MYGQEQSWQHISLNKKNRNIKILMIKKCIEYQEMVITVSPKLPDTNNVGSQIYVTLNIC